MIDVSQPLGPGTATWPGDRPFVLDWTMRRERGDSVDVAAIELSVHSGTHVDGPRHVLDGPGAGELALEAFMGPAVVVDARAWIVDPDTVGSATVGSEIAAGEPPILDAAVLDGVRAAETPRVLFRTREAVDPGRFPDRVVALSPALARRIVAEGFVLVGTDAPSVDPVSSTVLEAHRILAEAGVPNVENLVLDGVEPGRYTFVGFPLRLVGADSAPVRAVLVP